jgi:hypothetical protein
MALCHTDDDGSEKTSRLKFWQSIASIADSGSPGFVAGLEHPAKPASMAL